MLENADAAPEGIHLDDDSEWLVPVLRGWASTDDAHAKAVLIGLNSISTAGGWDDRGLAELIEDLHADDPNLLDGLGFTVDDLDSIMRKWREPQDPDEPPAKETPAVTVGTDDADESGTGVGGSGGREIECPDCGHLFTLGG
jgi:hypothetical protein